MHVRRIMHRSHRAGAVFEGGRVTRVETLHLLVREAQDVLQRLANGIVFVEVEVAVKVLQNNLIDAVVTTEDIEVMYAIDVDRSQEVELLGRVTVQGDFAHGVQSVVAGGDIV